MTKYRIRLTNGRVIGPFAKAQLFELKAKGHINGDEEAQVYPTGDWGPITRLDIYEELMDENKTTIQSSKSEETFVIDLASMRQQINERELEALSEDAHEAAQLTETIRLTPTEVNASLANENAPAAEVDLELDPHDEESSHDKTLINPVAQAELEKLRRAQAEEEKRLKEEEERKKIEAEREELLRKQAEEAAKLPEVSPHDSTQMLSLDKVKLDLLAQADEEEKVFEQELIVYEEENRDEREDDDEEEDEKADSKKAKKKKLLMIAAGLLLAYALFFPGDDSKKAPPFQHIPVQVIFPIPFDKADPSASKVLYTKGVEVYRQGTYPAVVQSGKHFKDSYENDTNNVDSLNMMVRVYAEELAYSKNKLPDAVTLFNIIQSKRPFLMQDPNGVMGINRFYMAIDKTEAAVDVVAKYLKLQPKNVTQELFAVYLESLLRAGRVDTAKQFYTALEKAPEKNQYSLESLIKYLQLNQEFDKAEEYLDDALKKFPQLVRFQLMKAESLLRDKKLEEAKKYLDAASSRQLEYNDIFRAKFFELSGLYTALQGDVANATKLLTASLKIEESSSLRMKLADLQSSSSAPDANNLIAESQAYKHLLQAQDFYSKKSYELALISAARATDASPGHIPATLFLAKVQMKLGLARQGLKTLEDLVQQYPEDKSINVALIEAYIDTYKFNDARRRMGIISGTDIRDSWEFASLNAKLALKMNDSLKALTWLRSSININPLNDHDIALLAEVMLRRSNFEQARTLLNKAIELDPVNPDYRILYARMIYETQDDQAAVGYLLGLLNDFGENPKVLAEIAIFYFRSGKVKDFQDYKAKLEKLPTRDKALYEFLIKAALLDERYSEVPILVEELIKIEPGDLESMMTAGKVLFESGKLVEAARWFVRIKEKLPSYPQVQYYGAKIKFLSGDVDGALAEVQEDLKSNGETDISLTFMGELYAHKGDLTQAENYYKMAQKINPRSFNALVGLAELSTKRNNFDLALDLYKKAMRQKGDEPTLHKKIGDVYRLLGQGTLAIESYKLYLEMNPEAPDRKQIEAYIKLMQ